jgi:hypothetical protein
MLAVDSSLTRDREKERDDLRMAFRLRNFCLMMSHDCSYTQTVVAICSCCVFEEMNFIVLTLSREFMFSYVCCLADIPEPLRELNDSFLQLLIVPATANGSEP